MPAPSQETARFQPITKGGIVHSDRCLANDNFVTFTCSDQHNGTLGPCRAPPLCQKLFKRGRQSLDMSWSGAFTHQADSPRRAFERA